MNQAIVTKFIGATSFRGVRIGARCGDGKLTIEYWNDVGVDENHWRAAEELRERLGWSGELKGGVMANGDYCWVLVPAPREVRCKLADCPDRGVAHSHTLEVGHGK